LGDEVKPPDSSDQHNDQQANSVVDDAERRMTARRGRGISGREAVEDITQEL